MEPGDRPRVVGPRAVESFVALTEDTIVVVVVVVE
jgi:hypothetical protein